ncbi:MAG: hypothetical protein ACOC3V_00845 [bacterium]
MKEKILEYFYTPANTVMFSSVGMLQVLDHENKVFYSGVTIDYIKKYVLKDKYSIQEIGSVLKELVESFELRMLFCGHVNNVVFEPHFKGNPHYSYNIIMNSDNFINPMRGDYSDSYKNYWSNIFEEKLS